MSSRNNPIPAVDSDWASPSNVHIAFLLLATLLGTYLCYLLALPFLPSLVWAIGLAVLAAPYQNWLETKVGHPGISSFICTSLLGLLVVIPVTFAIQQLALQASTGAMLMEAKMESGEWRQLFSSQPKLASLMEQLGMQMDLPGISKTLATSISSTTMSLLKGSVYQILDFGLTFYFLFFLLRDRALAKETLCKFSPLTIPQMAMLVQRVNETICATVYGSFVVAAVQGVALGATFWSLGLPAPFLWGVIMAFLGAGTDRWCDSGLGTGCCIFGNGWQLGQSGIARRFWRLRHCRNRQSFASRLGWQAAPSTHGAGFHFRGRWHVGLWPKWNFAWTNYLDGNPSSLGTEQSKIKNGFWWSIAFVVQGCESYFLLSSRQFVLRSR